MDEVEPAILDEFEALLERLDPAPWVANVEGRDGVAFASFIQVGSGNERAEDIYVRRDSGAATAELLDFLAAARNHLPALIAELRARRG